MKFKVLASLSLLSAVAVSAEASWPPKNILCEKAQISELSIFDGITTTDVCSSIASPIPEYLEAINDLREINHKASTLLGIPLFQLFPQGISIDIYAGYSGLNGSAKSSSKKITLSIYTHPYRWINKGIYAHELGHALTFSKTNKIPAALKSTHRSSMLGETIADTIAFALVGEETSHEMNLPLCFSAKRVTYNQSYITQAGFFDQFYTSHIMSACCNEYGNTNAETKMICQNVLRDEEGQTIELPLYNQNPFSFQDKTSFEVHRIGIPVNSFLLTLGQYVGKNHFQEFIQSYSALDPILFECRFKDSTEEDETVTAPAWSLKSQLQMIRSNLKIEEKINFDVLWTELGLQAAAIIDDSEMASRTSLQAEKLFIKAIRNSSDQYEDKRHCAEVFESLELNGSPDDSCKIKCLKPKKN